MGLPAHEPSEVISVCPWVAVPVTTGSVVFDGAELDGLPSPRKIPERTALGPVPVFVAVMVRLVLAAWLMGIVIQAPWLKSFERLAVWFPTVIVSRRECESKSTA